MIFDLAWSHDLWNLLQWIAIYLPLVRPHPKIHHPMRVIIHGMISSPSLGQCECVLFGDFFSSVSHAATIELCGVGKKGVDWWNFRSIIPPNCQAPNRFVFRNETSLVLLVCQTDCIFQSGTDFPINLSNKRDEFDWLNSSNNEMATFPIMSHLFRWHGWESWSSHTHIMAFEN